MLWWDWSAARRLGLLAAMLAIAATPWLLLGWAPGNWGAFAGGTALLTIPQVIAWFLYVGLRTGRMPLRGGREDRRESPTWFWIVAALYAAMLFQFAWLAATVLADLLTAGV